ncbi:MAG: hypothetical protein LW817_08230, partial [Candidatus Caenarcaniphilales bacterium]|nr:hypothetical protein [Candidatus Caenarcaniphilales bacterium]
MIKISGLNPLNPKVAYGLPLQASSRTKIDITNGPIDFCNNSTIQKFLLRRLDSRTTLTTDPLKAIGAALKSLNSTNLDDNQRRQVISKLTDILADGLFINSSNQEDFDEFVARINKVYKEVIAELNPGNPAEFDSEAPILLICRKFLINAYLVKVSEILPNLTQDDSQINLDAINITKKSDIKAQQAAVEKFGYTILDYPPLQENSVLIIPALAFDFDWNAPNAQTLKS